MFRLIHLFRTSIGKKLFMALSGLILVGSIVGHMLGNLAIYQGHSAINTYAAWLHGHPLLWAVRLFMLSIFLFHVYIGIELAVKNRASRKTSYQHPETIESHFDARHMLLSGISVLVFMLYHIVHLTLRTFETEQLLDSLGRIDVYSNVITGFLNPYIAISYILAMILVGLHLHHAIQSSMQTLGFNHESYNTILYITTTSLSFIVTLGFISIPVTVQLGLLR
jgi:succinate dehydrogenase / fumarate reductase cytochrome b subunit